MAADRVRVGYPRVSGPADSGLGMVSHSQFSVSVSGLVFHPIRNKSFGIKNHVL
jgi:hypothetical protein